jgi:hypothetical protein
VSRQDLTPTFQISNRLEQSLIQCPWCYLDTVFVTFHEQRDEIRWLFESKQSLLEIVLSAAPNLRSVFICHSGLKVINQQIWTKFDTASVHFIPFGKYHSGRLR